jgi:hypothetical protein
MASLMRAGELAAMTSYRVCSPQAVGPVKRDDPPLSSPELDEARRLMKVGNSPVVQICREAMKLTLEREGA